MRAHRMAGENVGEDVDYIPGWDTHGLPIEWKVEEEYRKHRPRQGRCPGARLPRRMPPLLCQHWLDVQDRRVQAASASTGDWARRYATYRFLAPKPPSPPRSASSCSMAALYRGLRPVMWSPVEKHRAGGSRGRISRPHQRHRLRPLPVHLSGPDRFGPGEGASVCDLDDHYLDAPRQPRSSPTAPPSNTPLVRVDSRRRRLPRAAPAKHILVALGLAARQVCQSRRHRHSTMSNTSSPATELEGAIAAAPAAWPRLRP